MRKPQPARKPRAFLFRPVPGYAKLCGWCAKHTQVVTDGRMLVCGECGH